MAPGAYTLRVAVRDGRGRVGSVDHHLEASLVRAGTLALSDLLIGRRPEAGGSFRPLVVPEATAGTVLAHGEIYSEDASALGAASASFEIVSSETGAPVRSGPVPVLAGSSPLRRLVQVPIATEGLAPGGYLARLVVAAGGIPRGAVVRPFRILAP